MLGFKPFGLPACHLESVKLSFEEYESLRLVNYEQLHQEEAARRMHVSRPTLTRIYNRALKTLAKALVEGKALEISGGSYAMDQEWYRCKRCHKLIEGLENHQACKGCPEFGAAELENLNSST